MANNTQLSRRTLHADKLRAEDSTLISTGPPHDYKGPDLNIIATAANCKILYGLEVHDDKRIVRTVFLMVT